tara:strand:+ start:579 stop:1859 length:1281 start_codon:yes stop_codon:yes gene_type:complete
MPTLRILPTLILAWAITGCSADKASTSGKAEPTKTEPSKGAAAKPKRTAPSTAAAPSTIKPTALETISRKGQDGKTRTWTALAGIEVADANYKELYQSRGEHFIGFKATVTASAENCLVHWRAEFDGKTADGKTASAKPLGKLEGTIPVAAGNTQLASAILDVDAEVASQIKSATVGYWTLCGDALPTPSVFDVAITKTTPEQIKFGKSFNLHHTRLALTSNIATVGKEPQRCYFELVVEDADKDGFTLNRDFASFSLRPGTSSSASMRRTTFEGGNERDYNPLVANTRSYLRKLVCKTNWSAAPESISGIKIENLEATRYEGEPTTAEQHVRATYAHSATFTNTMGKDCSFRIRYRMLDKSGMPLNRAPVLSEIVHLAKDAKVSYQSAKQRLFVWLEQADDVGALVAEQAAPVQNCAAFDAKQAL